MNVYDFFTTRTYNTNIFECTIVHVCILVLYDRYKHILNTIETIVCVKYILFFTKEVPINLQIEHFKTRDNF